MRKTACDVAAKNLLARIRIVRLRLQTRRGQQRGLPSDRSAPVSMIAITRIFLTHDLNKFIRLRACTRKM